jgi:hypothetical protein
VNGLRLLALVRLQLVVKAQRVIELAQFRRDDGTLRSPFAMGVILLGLDGVCGSGDDAMAVHAKAGRRNPGMWAFPGVVMAVDATDPQIARMLFVRKSNGLFRFVAFLVTRKWVGTQMVGERDDADEQSRK